MPTEWNIGNPLMTESWYPELSGIPGWQRPWTEKHPRKTGTLGCKGHQSCRDGIVHNGGLISNCTAFV
jgi:hypothetical protein